MMAQVANSLKSGPGGGVTPDKGVHGGAAEAEVCEERLGAQRAVLLAQRQPVQPAPPDRPRHLNPENPP